MHNQQDQILEMSNAVDIPSTHEKILMDIASRKYAYNKDSTYPKCNLFVSDMLRNYYGIEVPTRKEFKSEKSQTAAGASGKSISGWPDNPISASNLRRYFYNLNKFKGTGVNKVSAMEGSRLAAEGKPVIALGGSHVTLSSPHTKWPQVYRPSPVLDDRYEVGLRNKDAFDFFLIDKDEYTKFRLNIKGYDPDRLLNYGDVEELEKLLERKNND